MRIPFIALRRLGKGAGQSIDTLHAGNARMFLFLLLLTVASTGGLQGWRTLINNFSVEVAGMNGFQMGVVQGIREVPGLLSLLAVYLLLFISEHRLATLSVLVLGAGVAATGLFPTMGGLICTTLLLSFGFHYFETMNQSLTLQYFDLSAAPVVSGRLKAAASAANLAAGGAIFLLAGYMDYTGLFLLFGIAIALVAVGCMFMHPQDTALEPQAKKMILRKRYWLFYALTCMSGARRQIFVAFAVFLLVEHFNYSVQQITILFVINNLINMFLSPMIGRGINRFGERAILTIEYGSLLFVFIAYALTDSAVVAGALYVLDHIFFNFSIAIRTYFQKIAAREDIAPSMAMGFTINHIAAVIIPVAGGALWLFDYRVVFFAGAAMSLLSLVLAQCIRLPNNDQPPLSS